MTEHQGFRGANTPGIWLALAWLAGLHLAVLLAGFVAPYSPDMQDRELPYAPPTRIHFVDGGGKLHLRPFVYRWRQPSESSPPSVTPERIEAISSDYIEDTTQVFPVRFLMSAPDRLNPGTVSQWRLFGVEEPARIFLLGTDGYGRDQFSRLLYGGRISLLAGLVAAALSLGVGLALGAVAGFYGGWVDGIVMRGAELFLALPWLYLLFAIRAFLPLKLSPWQAFFVLISVIGLVGWARPARMIRGVVLSAKERPYVLAARGFGASDWHLLRHHVLPQTTRVLLTQAALLVPQYVLAEVVLSYLGLGVGEPVPSWGNLLAALQHYDVLSSYWWMFLPAVALVLLFLAYQSLTDALQKYASVVAT